MPTTNIQAITPDQIEKVYRGKESPGRTCRCGCGGDYYYYSAEGERAKLVKVLRMIQANEELAVVKGNIIDLVLGKGQRKDVFTIYLASEN